MAVQPTVLMPVYPVLVGCPTYSANAGISGTYTRVLAQDFNFLFLIVVPPNRLSIQFFLYKYEVGFFHDQDFLHIITRSDFSTTRTFKWVGSSMGVVVGFVDVVAASAVIDSELVT